MLRVKQFWTDVVRAFPELSDMMTLVRQAFPDPVSSRTVNVPEPAEMVSPTKLNPRTRLLAVDTVKPAVSAAPPLTPETLIPVTSN